MAFVEIVVRDREQAQKDERIDDVQDAEIACITATEMGNRSRHESDCEPDVCELLHLERNRRNHEREHPQNLGDRQFNFEVRRKPEVDEGAFRSVRERKVVVEDEVDDAEKHHGQDESSARAVRRAFARCQCSTCLCGCHDLLLTWTWLLFPRRRPETRSGCDTCFSVDRSLQDEFVPRMCEPDRVLYTVTHNDGACGEHPRTVLII